MVKDYGNLLRLFISDPLIERIIDNKPINAVFRGKFPTMHVDDPFRKQGCELEPAVMRVAKESAIGTWRNSP